MGESVAGNGSSGSPDKPFLFSSCLSASPARQERREQGKSYAGMSKELGILGHSMP